jgi:hypothetical protein
MHFGSLLKKLVGLVLQNLSCSVKSGVVHALGVKLEMYLSTNLEKEHKFHSTF